MRLRCRSTYDLNRTAVALCLIVGICSVAGFANKAQAITCTQVFNVNRQDDSFDGDCTPAHCSFRDAIKASNLCPGVNEIKLPSGRFAIGRPETNPSFELLGNAQGDFDILQDVKITGVSPKATILDGAFMDRILEVHAGITTISNLSLTNGRQIDPSRRGSAVNVKKNGIFIGKDLHIYDNGDVNFKGDLGGAIVSEGMLRIENSRFENNSTYALPEGVGQGGAIVVMGNSIGILSKIYATKHKNGVVLSAGLLVLQDSQFEYNTPDPLHPENRSSASVVIENGSTEILRCKFERNAATTMGGAVFFGSYDTKALHYLNISNSVFRSNNVGSAVGATNGARSGGAVAVAGPSAFMKIYGTLFDSNSATDADASGGAIDNWGNLEVIGSVFVNNRATRSGGAIFNANSLLVRETSLLSNFALSGGGMASQGAVVVHNSTFEGNIAVGREGPGGIVFPAGAAIEPFLGSLSLKGVTMLNNVNDPSTYSLLVHPTATLQVAYTAIGNDSGSNGCAIYGGYQSNGYNISQDLTCPFTGVGDQQGIGSLNLGALEASGALAGIAASASTAGDFVLASHRAPTSSSSLLNIGETFANTFDDAQAPGCTKIDARGTARPVGGRCDSGAVEAVGKKSPRVLLTDTPVLQ